MSRLFTARGTLPRYRMIESTETGTQVWSTTECARGSIRPVRRRLAAYIIY